MKSEERHQLQQNELADWLTKLTARVKPYIPHACAAVLLVFVGFWIAGLVSASRQTKRGEAWKDFFGAQNPEQLDVVIERHKDSDIVPYAKLKAAQLDFQEGKSKLFNDRTEALSRLDKAVKAFEDVAAKSPPGGLLKTQALLGIAVSKETSGAVTEAITAYKRLADECKGTNEALIAERQIKTLETPEAKEFYSRIKTYQPKTPSTDLPPLNSRTPGVDFTLPDLAKPTEVPKPPTSNDLAPPLPKADEKKPDGKKPNTPPAKATEKTAAGTSKKN